MTYHIFTLLNKRFEIRESGAKMPKSKRKRKAPFGSRKRKRAESGRFSGSKKPKNEIPSDQTDQNATTAKGSRADDEKTVAPQTSSNKVENIDTPVKPADDKNANRVVELRNMPMNEPQSVENETTAKRSRTNEKRMVHPSFQKNRASIL